MRKVIWMVVVALFVSSGVALSVPPGKTLEFDKSPMGIVKFDGTIHQKAGNKCKDCHNSEMFPKMKQGTVKISMNDLYAGKLCGVCHNGKRAFDTKGNCARCHIKQ